MGDVCRICTERDDNMKSLVRDTGSKELKCDGEIFEDCFGLKVLDIPNCTNLCIVCQEQLMNFYVFKQQAIKSHYELISVMIEEPGEKYTKIVIKKEIPDDFDEIEYLEDEETCLALQSMIELGSKSETNCVDGEEFEEVGEKELEEIEQISLDEAEICDDDVLKELTLLSNELEMKNETNEKSSTKRKDKAAVCTNEDFDELISQLTSETRKKVKNSSKKPRKTYKRFHKFKCIPCNKIFAIEETYTAHMNIHKGLPAYSCNICGKGFNRKFGCLYHMKNHRGERSWKCELCPKAFLIKWDLDIHMRSHNDERPYVCDICGKTFRMFVHLSEHKDTHTEGNIYECKFCNRKLHTKKTLKAHIKSVHENNASLHCSICNRQFNRRYRFTDHMTRFHERQIKP